MTDMFNTMRLVMQGQGELMFTQAGMTQDRLGPYYQYFRDEIAVIKDVLLLNKASGIGGRGGER